MSDGLKILLGALVGAIVVLLFVSTFGGGGMMGGMGSMMSGGMMGGGLLGILFALLFWGQEDASHAWPQDHRRDCVGDSHLELLRVAEKPPGPSPTAMRTTPHEIANIKAK